MRKLYCYSSSLLTCVEAKRATAKFAAGGILLGALTLLGVAMLNQSVVDTIRADSTNALTAENEILRQQLILISPQVRILEERGVRLQERVNALHKLLQRRKNVRDEEFKFAGVTDALKSQSLVVAAKSPRP